VTPHVDEPNEQGGSAAREPRVDRWVFSTDGVGWPVPSARPRHRPWAPASSGWTRRVPAPGDVRHRHRIEQNTHKIGEALDTRELRHAIAFIARFRAPYVAQAGLD